MGIGEGGGQTSESVCDILLRGVAILFIILTFPISIWWCIKVVHEYERVVIFRLGRLRGGAEGPGLFFIIPCTDDIFRVDLRLMADDVPAQEVLTRDSVTVAVDAVVYFKVFDPVMSVNNVSNARSSTMLLAISTLRNILGTKDLTEILTDRDVISRDMQVALDEATDPWGIKVERVEIKDVRLPVSMQRAMAAEAESAREARAKVIAAEGEQLAAVALNEAARTFGNSKGGLQLRYLQTLNTISATRSNTIVFPLPTELLK